MTGHRRATGPTLASIAREMGVSKATVSNAYNRPDQLSPALRQRVLDTAARLGYAGPDPVAATLSRGRVGAIGLVMDDPVSYAITDPAEVRFVAGVSQVCDEAGAGLLLVPGGLDTQLAQSALVDGFVCHTDVIDDPRLAGLLARRLPTVLVDGESADIPCILVDDRSGARAAAHHVLRLGHRRLAVLATPLQRHPGTDPFPLEHLDQVRYRVPRERLLGYADAVTELGAGQITVHQTAGESTQAGYRATMAILDHPPHRRPTAVLAMSDVLAMGALQAAHRLGLSVPADLSVVGFDDTLASATQPALTSVHQPHEKKGATAARWLLEGATNTTTTLPTELVVNDSTAVAPG